MSAIESAERILNNISVILRRTLVTYGEIVNINKKKKLWKKTRISNKEKNEIEKFYYENYGKKISTKWHRLYMSYTGVFCVDYFPEILLSTRLEPITNPYRDALLFGDKNLLHQLFYKIDGLHIPITYASCIRGIVRDKDDHLSNVKSITDFITQQGEKCVIKRTIGTSSGRDVKVLDPQKDDILNEINSFGDNFVIQELVKQHPDLIKLNESSLNTFRVMTYICDGRIFLCPLALRMGRSGADRDNIHYGGLSIGVNQNGTLKKCAFTEYGEKFYAHPDSQVIFENYRIFGINDRIKVVAKELHEQLPYLGILSWDLSIDADGNVVLIEVNTTGQSAWFCQMVNGEPLFGDNTAKMLQIIKGGNR